MYDHRDKVHGVMIGVGAGFDYHAGNIKRAPMWMQKLSLEWLYRLMQDPKRLFKRYLVTNTRYLWLTRTKTSPVHPRNSSHRSSYNHQTGLPDPVPLSLRLCVLEITVENAV